ncbi:MAG: hypothetical protein Kow0068_19160 [Marinilabiliales bacterium]
MKTIKIFIACVLVTNTIYSQRIGIFYGQNYYRYKFSDVNLNGYPTDHYYNNVSNFDAGILFELDKKVDFIGKMFYSTKGYQLIYKYTTVNSDPLPLPDNCKIKANYLDFSVGIGKSIINNNHFNFIPHLSIETAFLLEDKAVMVLTDGSSSSGSLDSYCLVSQNIESILYNGNIDIQLNYLINKRFSIFLQLVASYYFNKIEGETITHNPFAWGCLTGVIIKLKTDEN